MRLLESIGTARSAAAADGRPLALSAQDAALVRARTRALATADLLDTYTVIHGDGAGVAAFLALRDTPLPAAAAAFARAANVGAVGALLRRHRFALGRGALTALSSLPETLAATEYAPFLQALLLPPDAALQQLPRSADAVEAQDVVEAAAAAADGAAEPPQAAITERCAAAAAAAEGGGCGVNDVATWLVARALDVDDATGALPEALGLLKVGLRLGVGGDVPRTMQSLHMLQSVARASLASGDATAEALDARAFAAHTLPAQISHLLHACCDGAAHDDAAMVPVIETLLAPALSCLAPDVKDGQLSNVLQLEFESHPDWVRAIVAAEASVGCMLFSNVSKLGQAAVALVGSPAVSADWGTVIRVLQTVAAAFKATGAMPADLRDKWLQSLDKVCARVPSAAARVSCPLRIAS